MKRVDAQDLHYSFGERMVLRGLTLELEAGDVAIISGKNGAGKSTLLKLLAGILRPLRGTVKIQGLSAKEQRRPTQLGIGVCIQENFLYGDLTLEENFRLASHAMKESNPTRLQALISRFELESFLKTQGRRASQGVGQKASLLRAFLRSPGVLLLDEPYAHLDKDSRASLSGLILEESRRGAAVVCVVHDATPFEGELVSHWQLREGKLIRS